jgi:uncharacterized protein YbjT (DUF2867 family)
MSKRRANPKPEGFHHLDRPPLRFRWRPEQPARAGWPGLPCAPAPGIVAAMKAIVFGATGMIGQGLLRECLASAEVEQVLIIGRTPSGITHDKVRELVRPDLFDYAGLDAELGGWDACFFCLGVSSAGMTEEQYRKITHDLTLVAARALLRLNPRMTFLYISGAGTDSSERGRTMWARVKGATENGLLSLGFARAFMFRPGFIQPIGGIVSKTRSYRILYAILSPLYFLLRAFPGFVTSSDRLGRAMIRVARDGYARPILESRDINAVAAAT